MITTIYHVEHTANKQLSDWLRFNVVLMSAFEADVLKIRGSAHRGGSNNYDQWTEWAEFKDLADAKRFEVKLIQLISIYEKRLSATLSKPGS